MRIHPFLVPITLLVAFMSTVFTAQAFGMWSVTGRTAVNLENLNPQDIKGWMTLQQVMDGAKISQKDLYTSANIPMDIPTTTAVKDLEKIIPGFETTTIRDALAQRTGAVATPPAPVAQVTVAPTPVATHLAPTPLPAGVVLTYDQIKGKMTLREVIEQCAVSKDKLLTALKLSALTNLDTALKDLVSQGALTEVTQVQAAVKELQK